MADLELEVVETCNAMSKTQTATLTLTEAVTDFIERRPCHWEVTENEDGSISARSNIGDQYTGTREGFTEMLRE